MERNASLAYNTELKPMVISEYGRIIHDYVDLIVATDDRNKRTEMAQGLIAVMENLNPSVKQQENYLQKLWDHLYIISDFKLDVEAPFPPPSKLLAQMKPEPIPYPEQKMKFRFYGNNIERFVNQALQIQDPEEQKDFLSLLASFMKASSVSWNNEEITDELIIKHIKQMSKGELDLKPDDLNIKLDPNSIISNPAMQSKRKKNFKNKGYSKKRNYRSK